jgi:LEA14-like dessication related protein
VPKFLKVALIIILLCLQYACLGWIVEKPTFVLKDVSLTLHSMKELKTRITVEIKNPNRYSLNFESLEYRLALENHETGRGRYTESFEVPPNSVKEISIPLTMEFDGLGTHLKSFLLGKDIPYKIEGTVHLKVLWGSIAIPFLKDGSFNIKS